MLGSFHMCWLNTDREHSATLCVQKRECGGQNTPRVSVSVIRKSKEWWEGWSSTVWGHLAACLSSSKLAEKKELETKSSLTVLSWQTHESQQGNKICWTKTKGSDRKRAQFWLQNKNKILKKQKKKQVCTDCSLLPAARCLFPRQLSQQQQQRPIPWEKIYAQHHSLPQDVD